MASMRTYVQGESATITTASLALTDRFADWTLIKIKEGKFLKYLKKFCIGNWVQILN